MRSQAVTITWTCDACLKQVEDNTGSYPASWANLSLTVGYTSAGEADLCSGACASEWLSGRLSERVGPEWAFVTVTSEVKA